MGLLICCLAWLGLNWGQNGAGMVMKRDQVLQVMRLGQEGGIKESSIRYYGLCLSWPWRPTLALFKLSCSGRIGTRNSSVAILQWHLWYTWERVIFSYSSRKLSDELLIEDSAMSLVSCHLAILIYCLNILVSWLDLLHLIHLQYVQISAALIQTIRRDTRTNWIDATPNQKGCHDPSKLIAPYLCRPAEGQPGSQESLE